MPSCVLVVDDDPSQRRILEDIVKRSGFADLIAGSETMKRAIELGRRAAGSNSPALIEGESGVGKALIARAIMRESERSAKPFVTVNCGALPETSETITGNFTDAHGGTVLLEEVGALPPEAQTKLLRALQGDATEMDFRLIATTSADLIARVRHGHFREDLYYRLSVFPIWVPPLRMRLEDVPELVRHFTARFAAGEGKPIDGIDADAAAMLQRYTWPGNIRQLENAVFRAVVLADTPMLTVSEFPQIAAHVDGFAVTVPPAPAPKDPNPPIEGPVMLGQSPDTPVTIHMPASNGKSSVGIQALSDSGDIRSLDAVEADMIRLAFGRYRGRMTEIAKRLGIGRSTLYRKMREFGIEARPT